MIKRPVNRPLLECRPVLVAKSIVIISLSISTSWVTNAPSLHVHAFSPSPAIGGVVARQLVSSNPLVLPTPLYAETTQEPVTDNDTLPIPNDMRLREIQSELKERNISYADCFDRESLVKRLVEARDGLIRPISPPKEEEEEKSSTDEFTPQETSPPPVDAAAEPNKTPDPAIAEEFDRESTLAELRTLRVKELKVKLSEFKVRWGTMIEKEEMVQALCSAMKERFEQSKNFSRSGKLIPGTVADVEEGALIEELGWSESDVSRGVVTAAAGDGSSPHPPILLDVYATWCGPCQMVAPFLVKAAEELGPTVRVVKLDSDKYPRISSALRVGGLPTLIRFDGGDVSKEVQRIEGALTKDQIIDFANGNFNR